MQLTLKKIVATVSLTAIAATSGASAVSAQSLNKMPWQGGVSAPITQTFHRDGWGFQSIDIGLRAGTPVLAPMDSQVMSFCATGVNRNHYAILLRASNGARYSLIHVTSNPQTVFNGRNFKQGDRIGVIAADFPNDRCAVSRGVHLHFGLPSQNTTVDGFNLNPSSVRVGVTLRSTNGTIIPPVVRFSARTASSGVNVRSGPSTNSSIVRRIGGNQTVNFDAWQYGTTERNIWTGAPDARWYRIVGTNQWISGAVVIGSAPGSRPMP
jgi:hypothetical protein